MISPCKGLFLIRRDETSTADELQEFSGPISDRAQIAKQSQPK
jgi:hypothetical protein